MQLQPTSGAVAATWILAAGGIGVIGNVTSIGGGVTVLGFGLLPPILMMLLWRTPLPERIRRTTADPYAARKSSTLVVAIVMVLMRVIQGRRVLGG